MKKRFVVKSMKKMIARFLKRERSLPESYDPAFHSSGELVELDERTLEAARSIRGVDRKPAIIIHGVTQRSGTTYVGELLRLHPELHGYPDDIREFPFLKFTGSLLHFQTLFLQDYQYNLDKLDQHVCLPLFGSAFLHYLSITTPQEKRILLKVPWVQYLSYFFIVFPYESALLLLRDGRDVVASTMKTWPERDFSDVCRLWNKSARAVCEFQKAYASQPGICWLARYEDAVSEPAAFVRNACRQFRLNPDIYPYEQIKNIPVHGSSELKQHGNVTWEPLQKPKNFHPVGRWKEWTTRQKELFKYIAGETLLETGYCHDLEW